MALSGREFGTDVKCINWNTTGMVVTITDWAQVDFESVDVHMCGENHLKEASELELDDEEASPEAPVVAKEGQQARK